MRILGLIITGGFLLLFAGFWSTVTLTFDVKWAHGVQRQLAAQTHPSVEGRVLKSQVHSEICKKRRTEYANLSYAYAVDGREYTGTRIRYGTERGERAAVDFAQAHPAGSTVLVRYDPADPSDAVLLPGIQGTDLFMPMFLLPFNAVMLAFLIGGWTFLRHGLKPRGLELSHLPAGLERVRLPHVRPAHAAIAAAAAAGFVLIFVVAFSTRMNPSVGVMAVAWSAVAALSAWAYRRTASSLRRGAHDLDVDPTRKTITLPLPKGRFERETLRFDECEGIAVNERFAGKGEDVQTKFVVRLKSRKSIDGSRDVELAEYSERPQAEGLQDWLTNHLKRCAPATPGSYRNAAVS